MRKNINTKRVIAVALVASAALTSFLIIKSGSEKNNAAALNVVTKNNIGTNFNFDSTDFSQPGPLLAEVSQNGSDKNLTDAFTTSYLLEIFKRNSENDLGGKNSELTLPPQEVFESLLGEYASKNFECVRYGEKDLNISKDNSIGKQKEYITAVRGILQKNFDGLTDQVIALDSFFSENNPKPLRDHVVFLKSLSDESLRIPVPENNKTFQLQLVNVLKKEHSIYNAILGLNNDPLSSFSALNEILGTAEELGALNTTLEARQKEISS